jgi:hypothetical protein
MYNETLLYLCKVIYKASRMEVGAVLERRHVAPIALYRVRSTLLVESGGKILLAFP